MSIATEIQRLQNIKTDIRNALVEKGVSASTHNMADFSADILSIAGGGEVFAVIAVSYPVGSACTCTDGTTTLTATDTSGIFIFVIPNAGTWTITATLSGETASEIVSISTKGQTMQIEIDYRMPSEYQEVEYIQSHGTEYIDTGYVAHEGYKIEMSLIPQSIANSFDMYWGATAPTNKVPDISIGRITTTDSTSSATGYYGSHKAVLFSPSTRRILAQTSISANIKYNFSVEYTGSNINYTINDEVKSFPLSSTLPTASTFVFAKNDGNNNAMNASSIKLYKLKISENGIDLHDFIPCYRKTDNVAGMWDSIGKAFHVNAGTGTFIVGGNV